MPAHRFYFYIGSLTAGIFAGKYGVLPLIVGGLCLSILLLLYFYGSLFRVRSIRRLITSVERSKTGMFEKKPICIGTLSVHLASIVKDDRIHLSEFVVAKIKGRIKGFHGHPNLTNEILLRIPNTLRFPCRVYHDNRVEGRMKYLFVGKDPKHIVAVEVRRREYGLTVINTVFDTFDSELKRLEARLPVVHDHVGGTPHSPSSLSQQGRFSGVNIDADNVSNTSTKSTVVFIFILLNLFLIGVIRFQLHEKANAPLFDHLLGKTVVFEGVVVAEPKEKSFYQEVIVKIEDAHHPYRTQKILVQAPFYPRFAYGDRVSAKGKLKEAKDFKTDAGRMFPYKKFLAKEKIYYLLSTPTVTLIESGQGNPLKTRLFAAKDSFVSHIEKVIPWPESSLMSGMLIAGKAGLGAKLEDDFKEVGLIHIVVLSGYNVTIVAEAFIRSLSFLPRGVALASGAFGIVLFAIMAGGGSTIVRASIMALIALLGRQTGNMNGALRALFAAGLIMVLWNPLILRYDPSFHLSFMATFALITCTPLVKRVIPWAGEIVCSTLAVQIFLLPYLLWMNGSFAFVTFPANLLVLTFIPFTMLAGFLAAASSYISIELSYPFAMVAFVMLRYILRIVEVAKEWVGWGIG